jgi:ATP-dependent Clp protease adaptor protein ClpS
MLARKITPMVTQPPIITPRTRHTTVEQTEIAPLYHLILLDDDQHTYQYVIEMLGTVFGYSLEKSWTLARVVDSQGRVILETAARPQCETHQTQIHAHGADPRILTSQGPMSAILEQAP